MISSYISLQGISAGPIRIGSRGVWLQTTSQKDEPDVKILSFSDKIGTSLPESSYCRLQAGLPSITDPNGVVTVGFLELYGFKPDGHLPDMTNYVTKNQFNNLRKIIMGNKESYTNVNSIELRTTNLEKTTNKINESNIENAQKIDTLSGRVDRNELSIKHLEDSIADLGVEVFKDPIIFYAGGAKEA